MSQDVSKKVQDALKTAQVVSKMAQVGFKKVQDGSKVAQDASQMAQNVHLKAFSDAWGPKHLKKLIVFKAFWMWQFFPNLEI